MANRERSYAQKSLRQVNKLNWLRKMAFEKNASLSVCETAFMEVEVEERVPNCAIVREKECFINSGNEVRQNQTITWHALYVLKCFRKSVKRYPGPDVSWRPR